MANSIVQVSVSTQVAPTPPTLQKTGCIVSCGGTVLAPQTYTLLTQESDLVPYLKTAAALTTVVYSGSTVTATATAPHGLPVGQVIPLTIAGVAPAGYNGTFACTVTTTTAFTYALPSNPGTTTATGTWINAEVASVVARGTTFFSQGWGQSIYVLELGPNGATAAVGVLSSYLTTNPNTAYRPGDTGYFYIYIVPRYWDGNAAFLALLANYESPTSRTYFATTTTLATYSNYTSLMKSALTLIENPVIGSYSANVLTAASYSGGLITATTTTAHGVVPGNWFQITGCTPAGYNGWWQAALGTTGSTLIWATASNPGVNTVLGTLVAQPYASSGVTATEFSIAASVQVVLNYNPSATNRVTQLGYAYLYGVTPFIGKGTNSLTTTLENVYVNYVGTGAEGGISQAIMVPGTTMDGNDFSSYWYSVDWVQINVDVNVANAVINGSNNPINPLYYNQAGIDALQAVIASTMNSAIAFGLANGNVIQTSLDGAALDANLDAGLYIGKTVVNAIPFITYATENPSDYAAGTYKGFSIVYVPQLGFKHIVISVVVTELVAQA